MPAPTPCVRERASHSRPLTCLSPPPVCVYLLGTELDESFKEFGKNREVMGLCREGESSSLKEFVQAPGKFPCRLHQGGVLLPTLPTPLRERMLPEEKETGGQRELLANLVSGDFL